ncbi:MAG: 3-deoxy-D-manno-octulosonic-acid transferase [Deltaproteobacteria bacterium]|nr:3-deoxy-D-manno-octulosonic-acid transferase [Deltaproteobacteria bacterium]
MRFLYNTLLLIAAVPGLIFFSLKILITGKYRNSFIQKLGGRQESMLAGLKKGTRVWIHAVSVGEVTAAAPIVASIKNRRPDVQVVFSTSTETGQGMAKGLVKEADAFIYFPLDFPCAVHKTLDLVRPDVFALVETEIWPNFLVACNRRGISSLIVNGRISPRSFGKYQKTVFFWRRILENIAEAGMISDIDASRITGIGMAAGKIKVLGNAKYDALAAMASPALHEDIAGRLQVQNHEKFLVAGSTHPGEEDAVIEAYKKLLARYPEFRLILVPRHIERTRDVIGVLRQAGLNDIITYTEISSGRPRRNEKVIVVDVIGELFKIYSLGTIVYCGGSLVPKGGQNILEAAAWGRVIFYGPSMEDFSQEAALLEDAGAGIRIRDARELSEGMLEILADPQDARRRGERGRAVVLANMGAAERYAEMIIGHTG